MGEVHLLVSGCERKALIENVVVRRPYQRQGIGSRLSEELFRIATSWHCDRIDLTSNNARIAGQAFWESKGFTRIETQHFAYFASEAHAP
jgi:GNAT superfamily N-acetyltransferase